MALQKSAINSHSGFKSSIRNLFKCFGYYESNSSNNHYHYIEKVPEHHQESAVKKSTEESSSDHQKNPEVIITDVKKRSVNYNIATSETHQVTFSSSKVAVLEIHSRGGVRPMAKPVKGRLSRGTPGKPHRSIKL